MIARLRRHPIACFVVVTYAVTWGAWFSLAREGGITVGTSPQYLLGLCGPLIGALVTTAIASGATGMRDLLGRMFRFRVGLEWWAIAIGLPLMVAAATVVVLTGYSILLLAPVDLPTWAELGQFNGFPVASALVVWLMLVVVNGLGEETGWRGFLLPHVQRTRSPIVASLIVGGFWAAWHAPAFLVSETYRAMPMAMLPVFVAGLLAGSIVLTWLYNRGHQSIALVAAWHGTYNLFSGSVGARGTLAAVETAVVMVIAAVLVIEELRATRREHMHRPAHHVMASS